MAVSALLSEASLWEWSTLGVAAVLVALLAWLLAPGRRRRLRMPVVFMAFTLMLLPVRALLGTETRPGRIVGLAGAFFAVLALVVEPPRLLTAT